MSPFLSFNACLKIRLEVRLSGRVSEGDVNSMNIVQEILTLCVLTRIVDKVGVIKGKDTIIDIILTKDFLAKMKLMYSGKPYLTKYLELLLGQICQCPAYYKMLSSELKFEVTFPH